MSSIITMPSGAATSFQTATLKLNRSSAVLRSRYTGKRQVLVLPYAVWTFEGQLVPMVGAEAAAWRSFLVQLEGQGNLFRLPVPGTTTPVSNYSGPVGTVDVGSQTGRSLTTTGWSGSTLILKDGDYFTVNDELKVAVGDVTSGGGGTATIAFEPALRRSPLAGAQVITSNPTVLMSASDDSQAGWDLSKPVVHDIKLSAIEGIE